MQGANLSLQATSKLNGAGSVVDQITHPPNWLKGLSPSIETHSRWISGTREVVSQRRWRRRYITYRFRFRPSRIETTKTTLKPVVSACWEFFSGLLDRTVSQKVIWPEFGIFPPNWSFEGNSTLKKLKWSYFLQSLIASCNKRDFYVLLKSWPKKTTVSIHYQIIHSHVFGNFPL